MRANLRSYFSIVVILGMETQHLKAINYTKGEVVFNEGHPAGEGLYFVLGGELSVTRKRKGEVKAISNLIRGQFFGEVSLISGQHHHMTVTVTSPEARVAVIDAELFSKLCNTKPDFLHGLLKQAIDRLIRADDKFTRLTKDLEQNQRDRLELERRYHPDLHIHDYVNSLATGFFHMDEFIFHEGEDADGKMYVLFQGSLGVIRKVEGNEEVIGLLGPGDFFGEMALISSKPRAASIKVRSQNARVGILDQSAFFKIARSNPPFLYEILKMVVFRLVLTENVIDQLEG